MATKFTTAWQAELDQKWAEHCDWMLQCEFSERQLDAIAGLIVGPVQDLARAGPEQMACIQRLAFMGLQETSLRITNQSSVGDGCCH